MAEIAKLPDSVAVLWTGPLTSNSQLARTDFDKVNEGLARTVALWDNYWASDGGDGFMGRLPMKPYSGRDEAVASMRIVNNPAILGGPARLASLTAAWFQLHPDDWSRSEAIRFATDIELANGFGASYEVEGKVLQTVFEAWDVDTSSQWGESRLLVEGIGRLVGDLNKGQKPATEDLAEVLSLLVAFAGLQSEVYHGRLDPDLVDDLYWPTLPVAAFAETGLLALEWLALKMNGKVDPGLEEAVREALDQSGLYRYAYSPNLLATLIDAVDKFPAAGSGLEWPLMSQFSTDCTTGSRITMVPVPGCSSLVISGLPGASVSGDTIEFTPDHPGNYTLHAACLPGEGSGWAHGWASITCKP